MASPLQFKVYDENREYVAVCRHAEIAATVVALHDGGTIKYNGRIVWREGKEEFSAGDSFDSAAQIMWDRIQEHNAQTLRRYARARAATTV